MASLENRAKAYYIVFTSRNKKPIHKKLYFPKNKYTKREVLEIKKDLETRFKVGDYDPWQDSILEIDEHQLQTLEEAAEAYIDYKLKRDWGELASTTLAYQIRAFYKHIGNINLNELNADLVNNYINAPGLAYDTKKSYGTIIRTFINWLINEEHLIAKQCNPREIRVYGKAKSESTIKYISMEDQQIMAKAIYRRVRKSIKINKQSYEKNDLWMIDFMKWQRYSGMRLSETLRLKVGDIDPATWQITLKKTKAGKAQYLPIGNVAPLVALAKKRMRGKSKDDLLFVKSTAQGVSSKFRRYRKVVFPDNPQFTIHAFRHTCAIDLLKAGVDLYRVMRWLRHADVSTTMRYADMLGIDVSREVGKAFK